MSLKNRVFLGIYVFLLVFVFSIPGFSANKEAFVSISPIAKEYLPGQVVTLAVQPGTYYEELNQTYKWRVKTPGSSQFQSMSAGSYASSVQYKIPNLAGQYQFCCDYSYRVYGTNPSNYRRNYYLEKSLVLSYIIIVKAAAQATTPAKTEVRRLDGKLNCYNPSTNPTLPIDSIEIGGRVKCSIVDLKEVTKNSVGTEVSSIVDISRVKKWNWNCKEGAFEEVRTLEKSSLLQNEKVWLAPAKVGTYDLSCCVDYDGTLIATFTKQIMVVDKSVSPSTNIGMTILAPSPVKGLLTRYSQLNGVLTDATIEFKTPVVASSSLLASFEWKASHGSFTGLGKATSWVYYAPLKSSGITKVSINCSAKDKTFQILDKASKDLELVFPPIVPAYKVTISGQSPIKGADTYGMERERPISFSANFSVVSSPIPPRESLRTYQWSASLGTIKSLPWSTGGESVSWYLLTPKSAIPKSVDITCVQTTENSEGRFSISVTRTFDLTYGDPNYTYATGTGTGTGGKTKVQQYWACGDDGDCPTWSSTGRCGPGCVGGCGPSPNNPRKCRKNCSNMIPIGTSCYQCGRRSP